MSSDIYLSLYTPHLNTANMGRPDTMRVREVKAMDDVLDFTGETVYGDFRDDLVRDGFAVIKNAIPEDKIAQYTDRFHSYLEDL